MTVLPNFSTTAWCFIFSSVSYNSFLTAFQVFITSLLEILPAAINIVLMASENNPKANATCLDLSYNSTHL